MHFSDRLNKKIEQTNCIVVGIDPNFDLMPSFLVPKEGASSYIKQALTHFSKLVIDSTWDLVPGVKFQSAYFEQFGCAGIEALAESIAYAKEKELLVILDAKRGDIGSTSAAYAKAYLSGTTQIGTSIQTSSDLEVDCITINPFLGDDSLSPFVEIASQYQKGLFVLVKTSNPGSNMIQNQICNGSSISYQLAEYLHQLGQSHKGNSGYSCIGAVVGATFPEEAERLRQIMPNVIFLVPGGGHQGGSVDSLKKFFNSDGKGAIVPISRAITYSKDLGLTQEDYQETVRSQTKSFIQLVQEREHEF